MQLDVIHNSHCFVAAAELSECSIDCVVTSPPYWNLRDYGVSGQFGTESSADDYIAKLVNLFDILKPKLKNTATIFINLGDTYNNGTKDKPHCANKQSQKNYQNKSLLLLPYRFANRMCETGWTLRNIII
jgi:site-specific DNA-methyltransferase (adenine-specific)